MRSDEWGVRSEEWVELSCGVERGVAWCGVVWCSVVWCGAVVCGVVWRGVALSVVWHGVVCGVPYHTIPRHPTRHPKPSMARHFASPHILTYTPSDTHLRAFD